MSLTQRLLAFGCIPLLWGCAHDPLPDPAAEAVAWLYAGRLDSLTARATPELRQRWKERGGLDRLYSDVIRILLPEAREVARYRWRRGDVTHIVRAVSYEGDPARVRNLWIAFDPEGTLHRLSLRLADDDLCEAAGRPRITLRLPFEGSWSVLQAGPLREQNIHAADPRRCYGAEWNMQVDGSSHAGEGRSNIDYYAYGRPVLAPGSGVVAAVERGVVENLPGKGNYNAPLGNYVILDHRTGEYSMVTGLQGSSIAVSPGDTVIAGAALGACGNNGLRREPSIQMHLESEEGVGIPLGFAQVRVDGRRTAYVVPRTGQVMESLWRGSSSEAQQ